MSFRRFTIPHLITLVILIGCVSLCGNAQGTAKEKTLFDFGGNTGNASYAGMIFDQAHNLYGTTSWGGRYRHGTVFELSRSGHGIVETVLHSFTGQADGNHPRAALVMDSAGNLYGTTIEGGAAGAGTVFELTPSGKRWSETVLYSFTNGADGGGPFGALLFGPDSVLFGTTASGGAAGHGTVFELQSSGGGWTETVLYSFTGGSDGQTPRSTLIADASENLYGTTSAGGVGSCKVENYGAGCGTVFELSPSNGTWHKTTLYSFTGINGDGANSVAAVLFDGSGNLYGTTQYGGTGSCLYEGITVGCGTVFEVSPAGDAWTEKILYAFTSTGADDGSEPIAPLIFDSLGNLYGATAGGGNGFARGSAYGGDGTVFELSPANGSWEETVLHDFFGHDGARPCGGLIADDQGDLFGTTVTAGFNYGTVFVVRP